MEIMFSLAFWYSFLASRRSSRSKRLFRVNILKTVVLRTN